MFEPLDAHVLTVIPIVATIMLVPFYILGVYVFSEASPKKGMQIGTAFLLWGSLMFWVNLSDIPDYLWTCWKPYHPSLMAFAQSDTLLEKKLVSQ